MILNQYGFVRMAVSSLCGRVLKQSAILRAQLCTTTEWWKTSPNANVQRKRFRSLKKDFEWCSKMCLTALAFTTKILTPQREDSLSAMNGTLSWQAEVAMNFSNSEVR